MGLDMYLTDAAGNEVMYWRKDNAIHAWFCDLDNGVDECQPIKVPCAQLKRLVACCRAVLNDHTLAPNLLPTQSGFFFGGMDYDSYYFDGLKQTVEKLTPLLAYRDATFTYRASW